jgi:hypothetical protein
MPSLAPSTTQSPSIVPTISSRPSALPSNALLIPNGNTNTVIPGAPALIPPGCVAIGTGQGHGSWPVTGGKGKGASLYGYWTTTTTTTITTKKSNSKGSMDIFSMGHSKHSSKSKYSKRGGKGKSVMGNSQHSKSKHSHTSGGKGAGIGNSKHSKSSSSSGGKGKGVGISKHSKTSSNSGGGKGKGIGNSKLSKTSSRGGGKGKGIGNSMHSKSIHSHTSGGKGKGATYSKHSKSTYSHTRGGKGNGVGNSKSSSSGGGNGNGTVNSKSSSKSGGNGKGATNSKHSKSNSESGGKGKAENRGKSKSNSKRSHLIEKKKKSDYFGRMDRINKSDEDHFQRQRRLTSDLFQDRVNLMYTKYAETAAQTPLEVNASTILASQSLSSWTMTFDNLNQSYFMDHNNTSDWVDALPSTPSTNNTNDIPEASYNSSKSSTSKSSKKSYSKSFKASKASSSQSSKTSKQSTSIMYGTHSYNEYLYPSQSQPTGQDMAPSYCPEGYIYQPFMTNQGMNKLSKQLKMKTSKKSKGSKSKKSTNSKHGSNSKTSKQGSSKSKDSKHGSSSKKSKHESRKSKNSKHDNSKSNRSKNSDGYVVKKVTSIKGSKHGVSEKSSGLATNAVTLKGKGVFSDENWKIKGKLEQPVIIIKEKKKKNLSPKGIDGHKEGLLIFHSEAHKTSNKASSKRKQSSTMGKSSKLVLSSTMTITSAPQVYPAPSYLSQDIDQYTNFESFSHSVSGGGFPYTYTQTSSPTTPVASPTGFILVPTVVPLVNAPVFRPTIEYDSSNSESTPLPWSTWIPRPTTFRPAHVIIVSRPPTAFPLPTDTTPLISPSVPSIFILPVSANTNYAQETVDQQNNVFPEASTSDGSVINNLLWY